MNEGGRGDVGGWVNEKNRMERREEHGGRRSRKSRASAALTSFDLAP